MRLLVASGNAKKLAELTAQLAPLGVELVTPADVGGLGEVDEDQPTFEGNALKKARAGAEQTGLPCLADDSGLEVDALDGAPGVFSARFAGEHGNDAANNALLLERLAGKPREERGAQFVCALALVDPDGTPWVQVRGTVRGVILETFRGEGGFGYDPLFEFSEPGHDETGSTFAELAAEQKARHSHRGRAIAALSGHLAERLGSGA
jgi:XTP/dITP diphosphohydrolase